MNIQTKIVRGYLLLAWLAKLHETKSFDIKEKSEKLKICFKTSESNKNRTCGA